MIKQYIECGKITKSFNMNFIFLKIIKFKQLSNIKLFILFLFQSTDFGMCTYSYQLLLK